MRSADAQLAASCVAAMLCPVFQIEPQGTATQPVRERAACLQWRADTRRRFGARGTGRVLEAAAGALRAGPRASLRVGVSALLVVAVLTHLAGCASESAESSEAAGAIDASGGVSPTTPA